MKNLFNRKSLFWRYANTYAGIALISCIIVGLLLFNISVTVLNEAVHNEQEHKLKLIAKYLNGQTRLMQRMVFKLQNTYEYKPAVLRLGEHQYITLVKDFSHYNNYITISESYFLLYRDKQLVCLPTSTMKVEYFMEGILAIDNYAKFYENLLNLRSITLIVPEENPDILIFALPAFVTHEVGFPNDAVLCFYMSRKFLLERLTDVAGEIDGGLTFMFKDTMVNISESIVGKELTADDGNISVFLKYNGTKSYNMLKRYRYFTLILSMAIVFLILMAAVVAAYKNCSPIRRLVSRYENIFPSEVQIRNELNQLEAMLHSARNSSDILGQELAHQYKKIEVEREGIKRQYAKLLLSGGAIELSDEALVNLSNYTTDPEYTVFVLRVLNGKQSIPKLARMIEELSDEKMCFYTSTLRATEKIAILLATDEMDQEKSIELIEAVAETLKLSCILTVGKTCEDIREIPILFEEVLDRSKYNAAPSETDNAVQTKIADSTKNVEILKYIEENALDYDMGISTISEIFEIAPRQVSPIIRETCGMSFKEYLTSVRIKKACILLNSTESTVAEISEEVGFLSASYFINVFRNQIGETPANYRKKTVENNYLIGD